jgi:hypothetical protein
MTNGYCGRVGFGGIMLLAALLLWLSTAYAGGTITENFSNNQYNTQLWGLWNMGQGTTTQIINNRLEVNVAGSGYAGLNGWDFTLTGDFDMRVDFTMINWPANNGTQIYLSPYSKSSGNLFQVARANTGLINGQEQYFAIILQNYYSTGVTGSTLSGTLRLVRTGNKVEGFYSPDGGTNWLSIGSGSDAQLADRVSVMMGIGPYGGTYSGISAQAAFDNIQITYTTLGPAFEDINPCPGAIELLLD